MVEQLGRFSRRRFLAASGFTVASALVVACGGAPASPTVAPAKPAEATKPAAAPTRAPAASAPTQAPAAAPTTPPAATSKPAAKEKITIRTHNRAGVEGDVIEMRAKEWNDANPDVVFKPENFANAEYYQKIQTLIAGNQLGDVVYSSNLFSAYQLWALKNVLAPLDELVKADNFDSSPYFKEAWQGQIIGGKNYGITFKAHPGSSLLFFNKDLLDQAKLPAPTDDTTLDRLVEAAKAMTKAPDQFGYLIPNNDAQHLPSMLRVFGTQVISPDGKKAQLDSAEAIQALEFDYNLTFDLKTSPNKSQIVGNIRDMFTSGKFGLYKSGTWDLSVGKIVNDKFKWSVVVFPKGPKGDRAGLFTQDYESVSSVSKNKPEAWQIVKWLTDKRTGVLLGLGGKPNTGNSGTAGGRMDVYESDELKNNPDYTPEVNDARYRALKQTANLNLPANAKMNEVLDIVNNYLGRFYSGEAKDVKAFAQDLSKAVQVVVDKPL